MLRLSAFLLIALISIYVIKVKSKTQIWLCAVLIPLGTIFLSILLRVTTNSSNFDPYELAGEETAACLLVAIITGFVVYFLFKDKLNNEGKVKFPVALVVVMVITFIIGIIFAIFQYQANKRIQKVFEELNSKNELPKIEDKIIPKKENFFEFEGWLYVH